MRMVEIRVNELFLRLILNKIGLSFILNGTQEILNGKGLMIQEHARIGFAFERVVNSNVFKKLKKFMKLFVIKTNSL